MTGYTRQRDAETGPGLLIRASDLDAEFNQVQAAFNNSTGHTHTGAAGEGGRITEMGPTGELIVDNSSAYPKTNATYNLGSSTFKWNQLHIADQILPNGKTAAAPAYAFINDPNTGMFNGGADILSFSTGGTTRLTMSSTAITSTLPFTGTSSTFTGNVTAADYYVGNSIIWSDEPFSGITGGSTNVSVYGALATYIGAGVTTALTVVPTYVSADIPLYCDTFGAIGYGSAASPTLRFGPAGTGYGVYGTVTDARVSNGSADIAIFNDSGLKVGTNLSDVYHERNILGTVSQSAGVPTGAVIERGSNANGEYIRFADGTLICTMNMSVTDVSTTAGALFRSGDNTWTFPSPFAGGTASNIYTSGSFSTADTWLVFGGHTATQCTVRGVSYASKTGTFSAKLTAIGRWFV